MVLVMGKGFLQVGNLILCWLRQLQLLQICWRSKWVSILLRKPASPRSFLNSSFVKKHINIFDSLQLFLVLDRHWWVDEIWLSCMAVLFRCCCAGRIFGSSLQGLSWTSQWCDLVVLVGAPIIGSKWVHFSIRKRPENTKEYSKKSWLAFWRKLCFVVAANWF